MQQRLIKYKFTTLFEYVVSKRNFVSDISKDIAQLLVGIFAIESFTKNIINWHLVLFGVILGTFWWVIGIISFKNR